MRGKGKGGRGKGEGGRARKEFIFVQIDNNVHIKFSKMLNNQTSFLFQPGPVDFIFYFFSFSFLNFIIIFHVFFSSINSEDYPYSICKRCTLLYATCQ